MRYPRGSIQLNQSRDLPLLRQILRSEFVTHSQLFEFTQLDHYERSGKSFDWRRRRLVDRDLVRRQTMQGCTGEFVYTVAGGAAMLLQDMGGYCLVGRDEFNGKEAARRVLHAIGLNEIQLSALRAGVPKKIRHYKDVAASLGREGRMNHVLYLVCNYGCCGSILASLYIASVV